MLYEVKKDANGVKKLELFEEKTMNLEKELENCLIGKRGAASSIYLDYLQEELLLVGNQVKTAKGKISDVIALDRNGNGVVIELKKDKGMLGIETQALQYLVDLSRYKGEDFLQKFSEIDTNANIRDSIKSFLGDLSVNEINRRTRIILVARRFDETLFSMGEWLSKQGVAMKCVSYSLTKIDDKEFISFSVVFDKSDYSLYNLNSLSSLRKPKVFWHNIAESEQSWWEFLIKNNQLPACFNNELGDEGYRLLNSYIVGDTIIAYAKGYGAIGWGNISKKEYRLVNENKDDDKLKGRCRHRITIEWKSVAKTLNQGISPDTVRKSYDIYHPLRTSVSIDPQKAERLIKAMNEKFNR